MSIPQNYQRAQNHVTLADRLKPTLGNVAWLRTHEAALRNMLPDTWTLADNLGGEAILRLAFQFKLLGIEWRTTDEFGKVMQFLERLGIMQRQNGYQVRGNPSSIFE